MWITFTNRLLLYLLPMVGRAAQQIRQSLASHENGECRSISIHGAVVKIFGPSRIRMQGQREELSPHDLPEKTATLLAKRGIECDCVSSTSPGESRSTLSAAELILN
jgi:hypothetical protein